MKVEIEVPDSMPEKTARECFALGLKAVVMCNSGGLCVAYGTDENGKAEIKLMGFKGKYAEAVMLFCEGTGYARGASEKANIEAMKENMAKIFDKLAGGE